MYNNNNREAQDYYTQLQQNNIIIIANTLLGSDFKYLCNHESGKIYRRDWTQNNDHFSATNSTNNNSNSHNNKWSKVPVVQIRR